MILEKQAKLLEKLIVDNSPTILTAVGVVGTVTTAYLTGKAAFKANEVLDEESQRRVYTDPDYGKPGHEDLPVKDKTLLTWKLYIPAAGTGAVTVAAVICANRISARRMAALAVAYSLGEKRFEEFREKAYAKLTPAKQQAVRDEIAQDKMRDHPLSKHQVILTGNGDVMCYDIPSDRYFKSNMEKLRRTENDINQEVIHDNLPVTVADFYRYIGLKPTKWSEEAGWTEEMLLEVEYSTVLSEDNQPCIALNYDFTPIRRSSKSLSELDR